MTERELEKQRIRQEILAEEEATMRRRELEVEVRRELMMERVRRRDNEQWQQHGHASSYPPPLSGHAEIEGKNVDELPFQRGPVAKSPSKVISVTDEEKTIFCGIKRKDVPSPLGSSADTKKHKGEWSCDLCGITATSEMGLKDHITGKKHKAKQAKVGQKTGKIGLSL